METSVIVVKENTNLVVVSFGSTKKSKKILKIVDWGLTILYCMVYYTYVRGREKPSYQKRIDKGDK